MLSEIHIQTLDKIFVEIQPALTANRLTYVGLMSNHTLSEIIFHRKVISSTNFYQP